MKPAEFADLFRTCREGRAWAVYGTTDDGEEFRLRVKRNI